MKFAEKAQVKHIPPILDVPGMLSQNEGEYLYHLAQLNPGKGVIVEIGSWKGKSTICLALGSMGVSGEKVYAVDPHKPLAEEGYTEDTEAQFRENIRNAGVESHVARDATPSMTIKRLPGNRVFPPIRHFQVHRSR